jgi:hypothetical protein
MTQNLYYSVMLRCPFYTKDIDHACAYCVPGHPRS